MAKNPYKNKYSDVAEIYDVYANTDYDEKFWLSECGKEKDVLEITAGTGRITIPLARSKVAVTALDISKELLAKLNEKCKKEKLKVNVHEADMRDFHLGRKFPLIIIPFQSLQELTSPKDHEATLKCIREHLADGGRAVITLHNPQFMAAGDIGEKKLIGEYPNPKTGGKIMFWLWREVDAKKHIGVAHQLYEFYDKGGKLVSRKMFENRHYVFAKGEFEALAKKAGFAIRNVWGGYAHEPVSDESRFKIYEMVTVGSR